MLGLIAAAAYLHTDDGLPAIIALRQGAEASCTDDVHPPAVALPHLPAFSDAAAEGAGRTQYPPATRRLRHYTLR